ncbi:MAG: hypothetical protein Kow0074_09290 [Candidatus Zixiibacteriota bacterium]
MSRTTGRTAVRTFITLFAVCFAASVASADLTVKQKAETTGLMGFLDMEMKTTTYLKGDLKCDETEAKMTNSLMKMMGGGKPIKTTSVVNLADETVLNIDHRSKRCTQMSLDQMDEMSSAFPGMADSDQMPEDQQFDTSQVTMEPPEVTIEKTGKSEKIAGYDSEQYLVNMHVKGKDNESGEEFDFYADMDLWIAKDVPGYEEFESFNQKMIEKMGMDASVSMGGSMVGMLEMYGVDSEELARHTEDLKGFPMRTIMKIRGSGGQFDQMTASSEGMEGAEQATKMLKGLFGGGGDDDEEKDESGGDEQKYFMTMRTEVEDISTGEVKADKFTCPEKYESDTSE